MKKAAKSAFKNIFDLVTNQTFLFLTVIGNSFVVLISTIFYFFEHSLNPKINIFFDAVWWGFTTVTTVGYGDIVPVTVAGKILGILLMLGGTALFATFTALFAKTLLD